MARTRLMEEAPRNDMEILAFSDRGKTLHPVKWCAEKNAWVMRWNNEYLQHDADFLCWVDMPEVNRIPGKAAPQIKVNPQ